jgi:2-methylisocitrate lyase-like PEP mutase family enzyme
MSFRDLHYQNNPLLIGNVWDVPSAMVAEKLQFQALGTSSTAIAKLLGYNDGEDMSFDELEFVVKRITANAHLPLSVDIEAGYSREPQKIAEHISRLIRLGVVGINIEDSIVESQRVLQPSYKFAQLIAEVRSLLAKAKLSIFINVRTDTFLLDVPNKLNKTITRIKTYEAAGADGVFVPCVVDSTDVETIVKATSLPINVLSVPNLPNFNTLGEIGVKRISTGNFLFDKMYNHFEKSLTTMIDEKSSKSIF